MLSVLFAIETCYAIKANNNNKKSRSLRNLEFCWRKLRKDYLASAFSCRGKKVQFSRVDDTQLSRLRKAYTNNSSITIKLTTAQLSKMVQLGAF